MSELAARIIEKFSKHPAVLEIEKEVQDEAFEERRRLSKELKDIGLEEERTLTTLRKAKEAKEKKFALSEKIYFEDLKAVREAIQEILGKSCFFGSEKSKREHQLRSTCDLRIGFLKAEFREQINRICLTSISTETHALPHAEGFITTSNTAELNTRLVSLRTAIEELEELELLPLTETDLVKRMAEIKARSSK